MKEKSHMNLAKENTKDSKKPICSHCRGSRYVLGYLSEKYLKSCGMRVSDLPPEAFEKMRLEEILYYCHCNTLLTLRRDKESVHCKKCDDTTWLFTETGENAGYHGKKVLDLSLPEIVNLPCEYFKRCPCCIEDNSPKQLEKKKSIQEILSLLDIKIPNPGFAF